MRITRFTVIWLVPPCDLSILGKYIRSYQSVGWGPFLKVARICLHALREGYAATLYDPSREGLCPSWFSERVAPHGGPAPVHRSVLVCPSYRSVVCCPGLPLCLVLPRSPLAEEEQEPVSVGPLFFNSRRPLPVLPPACSGRQSAQQRRARVAYDGSRLPGRNAPRPALRRGAMCPLHVSFSHSSQDPLLPQSRQAGQAPLCRWRQQPLSGTWQAGKTGGCCSASPQRPSVQGDAAVSAACWTEAVERGEGWQRNQRKEEEEGETAEGEKRSDTGRYCTHIVPTPSGEADRDRKGEEAEDAKGRPSPLETACCSEGRHHRRRRARRVTSAAAAAAPVERAPRPITGAPLLPSPSLPATPPPPAHAANGNGAPGMRQARG